MPAAIADRDVDRSGHSGASGRSGRNDRSRLRAGLVVAIMLGLLSGVAGCGNEADLSGPAPAATLAPAQTQTQTQTPAPSTSDLGVAGAPVASPTPKTDPVLVRLNQVRAAGAQCGSDLMGPAPPLRAQIDAEEAAAAQTTWMQANRTMSHQGAGGSTVGTRLADAGFAFAPATPAASTYATMVLARAR